MQNGTGSREETDVHESLKHSTARADSDKGERHSPPGDPYIVKAGEISPTVGLPLAESDERLVHVSQGFQHNKCKGGGVVEYGDLGTLYETAGGGAQYHCIEGYQLSRPIAADSKGEQTRLRRIGGCQGEPHEKCRPAKNAQQTIPHVPLLCGRCMNSITCHIT